MENVAFTTRNLMSETFIDSYISEPESDSSSLSHSLIALKFKKNQQNQQILNYLLNQ